MSRPVCHILASCRNEELFQATLLVFKTVRIGFPTAQIVVWKNGLNLKVGNLVDKACQLVGAQSIHVENKSHGQFIEALLEKEEQPFWIADTDLVFFGKVEDWFDGKDVLFAGRKEPQFYEKTTRSIHVARLHPSLMFFNSNPLRAEIRGWNHQDSFFYSVEMNLIKWNFVPYREEDGSKKLIFYDTTAGLHHAIGGTEFTEEQNKSFGHLFAGTYSDVITESVDLPQTHDEIFKNPELARGLWAKQQEWYCKNKSFDIKG